MKEEALLPCPFCRGKASLVGSTGQCKVCGAQGPHDGGAGSWNTCTNPAPIPDEEKLLGKMIQAVIDNRGQAYNYQGYEVSNHEYGNIKAEMQMVLAELKPYLRHKSETSELREVREALAAYTGAEHIRTHHGNDEPGHTVRVWVSDLVNGKKALATLDRLLGKEDK